MTKMVNYMSCASCYCDLFLKKPFFMPLIERFSSWPSLKLFDGFSPEPPSTLLDQPLFLLLFLQVFQHVGSKSWQGSQGHRPCCECSCCSKPSTVVHTLPLRMDSISVQGPSTEPHFTSSKFMLPNASLFILFQLQQTMHAAGPSDSSLC